MKILIAIENREQYRFRITVTADGRLVHDQVAQAGDVIEARNRLIDRWSSRADVSEVIAAAIPWHVEIAPQREMTAELKRKLNLEGKLK
jgi:hypothetical protein